MCCTNLSDVESSNDARAVVLDVKEYMTITNASVLLIEGASIKVMAGGLDMSYRVVLLRLPATALMNKSYLRVHNNSLVIAGNRPTFEFANVLAIEAANLNAKLSLHSQSVVEVQNNALELSEATEAPNSSLLSFAIAADLSNGSSLLVSNNTANIMRATSLGTPLVGFPRPVTLRAGSLLQVSGNALVRHGDPASGACPAPALQLEMVVGEHDGPNNLRVEGNMIVFKNHLVCAAVALGDLSQLDEVTIAGNALHFNQTAMVSAQGIVLAELGVLNLTDNALSSVSAALEEGSLLCVSSQLVLAAFSRVHVLRNMVAAPLAGPPTRYLLINASVASAGGPNVTVFLCGNIVFGDPRAYQEVSAAFGSVGITATVVDCVTPNHTVTATASLSSVASFSPTVSQGSPSASSSSTRSFIATRSAEPAATGSQVALLTRTSPTRSTPPSHSPSTSNSALPSHSPAPRRTATASATSSCLPSDGLDPCRALRPLPVGWDEGSSEVAGAWLSGGNCTPLSVPFAQWTGRPGAIHTLFVAAVDPRVALRSELGPLAVDGSAAISGAATLRHMPVTFDFASAQEANASGLPVSQGKSATVSLPTAELRLRYDGAATLGRVQYRVNLSAWTRCPLAAPAVLEVTLLASERLLPVGVTQAVGVGGGVVSLVGGLTVSPTAVAQLGVVTSLRQMSRCSGVDLDDEEDASAFADGVANPFGIGIGDGGGRRHVRGALAMSAIYLCGLSALMFAYTTASSLVASVTAGTPRSPLLAGYPSALVAVASFVMDGGASAGMLLAVQGGGWGDRLVGALAVGLCVVFVCHVLLVTTARFPRSLVAAPSDVDPIDQQPSLASLSASSLSQEEHAPPEESDAKLLAEGKESILQWLSRPTHRWATTGKGAGRWLARYESYIADARVPWYCGLEQGAALLVCVLSALPLAEVPYCVARGVVCAVVLLCQCGVMVALRPPVHRWRWLLLSAVLVLQVVTAVLSTANAPLQDQRVELGMDALGAAIFLLLGAATFADVVLLLRELRGKASAVMAALRARMGSQAQRRRVQHSQSELEDVFETSEEGILMVPVASTTCNVQERTAAPVARATEATSREAKNAAEEAVVQSILAEFRAFESRIF